MRILCSIFETRQQKIHVNSVHSDIILNNLKAIIEFVSRDVDEVVEVQAEAEPVIEAEAEAEVEAETGGGLQDIFPS